MGRTKSRLIVNLVLQPIWLILQVVRIQEFLISQLIGLCLRLMLTKISSWRNPWILRWAEILVLVWLMINLVYWLALLSIHADFNTLVSHFLLSYLEDMLLVIHMWWWSFTRGWNILATDYELCIIVSILKFLINGHIFFWYYIVLLLSLQRFCWSFLRVLNAILNFSLTKNWLRTQLFSYDNFSCRVVFRILIELALLNLYFWWLRSGRVFISRALTSASEV